MKRILFTLFVLSSVISFGQEEDAIHTDDYSSNAVHRGNFIIEAYFGGPNFRKAFRKGGSDFNEVVLEEEFGTSEEISRKVTGLEGVGGRFEFMVADKFGIGAEVVYNSVKVVTEEVVTTEEYDDTQGIWTSQQFTNTRTYTSPKLLAMAMFNYHFYNNNKLDAFISSSIGWRDITRTWVSTDPNGINGEIKGINPLGARFGVGGRYFPIPNVGIHAQLSIGGPLIAGGITIKL
jgi:hypothetical protein